MKDLLKQDITATNTATNPYISNEKQCFIPFY